MVTDSVDARKLVRRHNLRFVTALLPLPVYLQTFLVVSFSAGGEKQT